MKKVALTIIPLLLFCVLGAFDISIDGEIRTRAAMYYIDADDSTGSHIDNKLWLGLNSSITSELNLRVNLQFGDIVWGLEEGDSHPGGGISAGVPVSAYELYVDYRIKSLKSNIRVGQQYWADHRSLMLDDSFSGVMFTADDVLGMQAALGWMKQVEGSRFQSQDDSDSFLLSLQREHYGLQAFYTVLPLGDPNRQAKDGSNGIITALPFAVIGLGPLNVDLTGIAQYATGSDDFDFGAAGKATLTAGPAQLGVDALYYRDEDHGLNESISPYYMNGLYIFGVGKHFDGWVGWDPLNWYWGQSGDPDQYLGLVGSAKVSPVNRLAVFAAGGTVLDTGWEVNGGIEWDLIPDNLQLAAYGAYGKHQGHAEGSYLLGSTLKASFY
jgi:hypothetical protein